MKRNNVLRFDSLRSKGRTIDEVFTTTEGVTVTGKLGVVGLFEERLREFPHGGLFAAAFTKRFQCAPLAVFNSIAIVIGKGRMKHSILSHFLRGPESELKDMHETFVVEPAILATFPNPCYKEQWFSVLEEYYNDLGKSLTKPGELDPWALYLIDLIEALYNSNVTLGVPKIAKDGKTMSWVMGNDRIWNKVTYNFPDTAKDFWNFINR